MNTRDELGPAGAGRPESADGPDAWRVIHSGVAETAETPAARAVMRTSDGEFRITASHVDGKVGLTIEMLKAGSADLHPEGDAEELMNLAAELSEALDLSGTGHADSESIAEAHAGSVDHDEADHDEFGDHSPNVIRGVLGPTALPRPRRSEYEGFDGRHSEAA